MIPTKIYILNSARRKQCVERDYGVIGLRIDGTYYGNSQLEALEPFYQKLLREFRTHPKSF